MFDDTNPDVVEETQLPTDSRQLEEQPQEEAQQSASQKPTPQESFKQLREQKEALQRERDEYQRQLQLMQQQIQHQQQPQVQEEPDVELADDDLVSGKQMSKMGRKLKAVQQELQRVREESYNNAVQSRIASQFPDFDSVVNEQNIKQLRTEFPELADSIHSNPDIYNKAVSAYKAIKRLGIIPEPQYVNNNEREIIQRNVNKPKTAASISKSYDNPLANANAFQNGLTDDLKKQLAKEMFDARKAL